MPFGPLLLSYGGVMDSGFPWATLRPGGSYPTTLSLASEYFFLYNQPYMRFAIATLPCMHVGPGDIGDCGGAMVPVSALIGAIIGIILLAGVFTIITLLMYQKKRYQPMYNKHVIAVFCLHRTKAEQPSEAHTLYDTVGGTNSCVVENGACGSSVQFCYSTCSYGWQKKGRIQHKPLKGVK